MPEAALHVGSGKVRELYALDDERLLLVASDRISTFDVVLPTDIPDKGRVLTGLGRVLVRPHAGDLREPPARAPRGRTLDRVPAARDAADRVRRARLPRRLRLEGLHGDRRGLRSRAARRARPSPRSCRSRSSRPRRRPTTGHDENIDREQAAELVGAERLAEVERVSIALYRFAAEHARERGILIADTKFEFGLDDEGQLVLGDEALTPDSSRFWPADEYTARRLASRRSTSSSSATTARRSGGTRRRPGPELPEAVVTGTRARYVEAFERLTGIAFDDYLADPEVVLR